MTRPPPQSFVLRLWREQADAPLRATLFPVAQPHAPYHFATLDALQDFLRAEVEGRLEPNDLDVSDYTAFENH